MSIGILPTSGGHEYAENNKFGVGYLSLNNLKKFHIQKLKIDKTFINDISHDPDTDSVVNAIIAMAHNLNLKIIAEGVENKNQIDFLRSAGCDEFQGNIYTKPLSTEEFNDFLTTIKQ
ncbi:MAG: EAL domain-containing protein [Candidatus Firestonebacteria bacterium]|nr:EAL domain-containing protein [Candidatus Firestonebacteria bacterium]